jgi:1-acyl-sn-glycerol-3-phosphate acyltransferase
MWIYDRGVQLLRPATRRFFRASTVGAEHVPARGPLLVAVNHGSFLDPWFVDSLFPRCPIRYLINEPWYRRSRLWTLLFDIKGVIPSRPSDPAETILRVVEHLLDGGIAGIFPEGRISHDGRMSPGQPGVAWMAALSGVPLLPCGLRGNFEAMPRHRRIPSRRPVKLLIGEPLCFSDGPVPEPEPAAVHAFADRIMERICVLAGRNPEEGAMARHRTPLDLRRTLRQAIAADPQRRRLLASGESRFLG